MFRIRNDITDWVQTEALLVRADFCLSEKMIARRANWSSDTNCLQLGWAERGDWSKACCGDSFTGTTDHLSTRGFIRNDNGETR